MYLPFETLAFVQWLLGFACQTRVNPVLLLFAAQGYPQLSDPIRLNENHAGNFHH